MVNLSQPLSFQTVAMAALDAVESRSSTGRSQDERVLRSTSQALEKDRTLGSTTAPSISLSISDDELDLEDGTSSTDYGRGDWIQCCLLGYDSSDSFCLIPSTSDSTKTVAKLKKENSTLKSRLESMEKQMISVQKQIALRNEQDQQLRDNIVLARKEVCFTAFCSCGRVYLISPLLNRHREQWQRRPHLQFHLVTPLTMYPEYNYLSHQAEETENCNYLDASENLKTRFGSCGLKMRSRYCHILFIYQVSSVELFTMLFRKR